MTALQKMNSRISFSTLQISIIKKNIYIFHYIFNNLYRLLTEMLSLALAQYNYKTPVIK